MVFCKAEIKWTRNMTARFRGVLGLVGFSQLGGVFFVVQIHELYFFTFSGSNLRDLKGGHLLRHFGAPFTT